MPAVPSPGDQHLGVLLDPSYRDPRKIAEGAGLVGIGLPLALDPAHLEARQVERSHGVRSRVRHPEPAIGVDGDRSNVRSGSFRPTEDDLGPEGSSVEVIGGHAGAED
jgi:hypothetical protein